MTVSPIMTDKNGAKYAYIEFSDGINSSEGIIPACLITKNKGFSDEEVKALEAYMKKELSSLKKMAASSNPFRAMMK